MRFRHRDGNIVHLAYCSNVHPAEDVDGIVEQLGRFAAPVRAALGSSPLGVGLWLSADAAAHLRRDPRALARLRDELARRRLEVVTFNGFPYRSFHAPVVKHAVYRPDWTDPARLAYTVDLAELLAAVLPDDVEEGSISTLPLGWRSEWSTEAATAARDALARLAERLAELESRTGRRIRVGLEPEPGCAVETIAQARDALREADAARIGVCLDACHLAVQFEQPAEAVATLGQHGLTIVKSQLSSALRVREPRSSSGSQLLSEFVEPRFLHQTRERTADGALAAVDDLEEAIAGGLPGAAEWRVHFHVPVHADGGTTTQPELLATLAALVGGPAAVTRQLEVETYTWLVLPPERRPADDRGLVDGIARELAWARDRMLELGLEEVAP